MISWTMEGALIFTGILALGLMAERPRKMNVAESISDQWLEQARLMSACLNQISGDISAIRILMEEHIYEHGLRDEPRRPDVKGRASGLQRRAFRRQVPRIDLTTWMQNCASCCEQVRSSN